MQFAEIVLALVGGYAAVGLLFAVAFVTVGAARIDPAMRETSVALRLLLIPGSVALWPILWRRWKRGRT